KPARTACGGGEASCAAYIQANTTNSLPDWATILEKGATYLPARFRPQYPVADLWRAARRAGLAGRRPDHGRYHHRPALVLRRVPHRALYLTALRQRDALPPRRRRLEHARQCRLVRAGGLVAGARPSNPGRGPGDHDHRH